MLDEGEWEATRESAMTALLPFHREMLQQLLDEDGLCVMSAGLGWEKVRRFKTLPGSCKPFRDGSL